MARVAVVLQARVGSARLPGKVLAHVGGRTILDHCVLRLSVSGLPVIVATTTRPEDNAVEAEARAIGAEVFRGDEHDVLSRFIAAARAFDLTEVVRATADNPLVDGEGVMRVVEFRRRVNADHVMERGLPVGMAVEAVAVDALSRANAWVTDPYDREHVTSFIRRDARFRVFWATVPAGIRRPSLRLTVDTPADLELVRAVVQRLGSAQAVAPIARVIAAADSVIGGRSGIQGVYATR